MGRQGLAHRVVVAFPVFCQVDLKPICTSAPHSNVLWEIPGRVVCSTPHRALVSEVDSHSGTAIPMHRSTGSQLSDMWAASPPSPNVLTKIGFEAVRRHNHPQRCNGYPGRQVCAIIVSKPWLSRERGNSPVQMEFRTGREASAGIVVARQPSSTSTLAVNFSQSMSSDAELSKPARENTISPRCDAEE